MKAYPDLILLHDDAGTSDPSLPLPDAGAVIGVRTSAYRLVKVARVGDEFVMLCEGLEIPQDINSFGSFPTLGIESLFKAPCASAIPFPRPRDLGSLLFHQPQLGVPLSESRPLAKLLLAALISLVFGILPNSAPRLDITHLHGVIEAVITKPIPFFFVSRHTTPQPIDIGAHV